MEEWGILRIVQIHALHWCSNHIPHEHASFMLHYCVCYKGPPTDLKADRQASSSHLDFVSLWQPLLLSTTDTEVYIGLSLKLWSTNRTKALLARSYSPSMSVPRKPEYRTAYLSLEKFRKRGACISGSLRLPPCIFSLHSCGRFPGQEFTIGSHKIPTVMYYDKEGKMVSAGAESLADEVVEKAGEEDWLKVQW